jgi:polysaccharide pyruvyl transferase WcaK-like protein
MATDADAASSPAALAGGGRPPSILILAGDADSNLGDRAILQAMVRELRQAHADATITVVSSSAARLGVDVMAISRGPRGFLQLCAAAVRSDLVLCGGGGLFQDDDSLIKMPYWCLRVLLMRLLAGRVVGYSLGVGPLRFFTSRLGARLAFAAMAAISVRDSLARDTAQSLTSKPVSIVPDPALLLPMVDQEIARNWLSAQGVPLQDRALIGVAVRRWFPPGNRIVPHHIRSALVPGGPRLSEESEHLAALLAGVLDELIRRHDAYVVLMPSYGAPHEGDVAMSRHVMANMSETGVQLLEVDDPALYKGITSLMSLFLGGRMHPTIFAASAGTPVIGLEYNPKFSGFFGMLGLNGQVMNVIDFVRNERVTALVDLASAALQQPGVPAASIESLAERIRGYNLELLGFER